MDAFQNVVRNYIFRGRETPRTQNNPEQLWETTLDKNYRSLLSVKIDEINEANSIFETLMGDVTDGRKNFIQENSLKVVNLDI